MDTQKLTIQNNNRNIINITGAMYYFYDDKNFPFVIFDSRNVENGIIYFDFKIWPEKRNTLNVKNILNNLVVVQRPLMKYTANNSKSVIELPIPYSKNYRLLGISCKGIEKPDGLTDIDNFLLIGMFIPNYIMKLLPPIFKIKDIIIESIGDEFPHQYEQSEHYYIDIKQRLISTILLLVLNPLNG